MSMPSDPVGDPPPSPWYRHPQDRRNRPWIGCGCLTVILVTALLIALISGLF